MKELMTLLESDLRRYWWTNDDEFTFQVDKQGRATRMILHVDGKDIPLKRID